MQFSSGRWLHIFPDDGNGYRLYDPLEGEEMGRMHFDQDEHWIYHGELPRVDEQEEAAGTISGYQKKWMNYLTV